MKKLIKEIIYVNKIANSNNRMQVYKECLAKCRLLNKIVLKKLQEDKNLINRQVKKLFI